MHVTPIYRRRAAFLPLPFGATGFMGLRVAPAFTAPLVVRFVAGFRAAFFLPAPVAPPLPAGYFTPTPLFELPRALRSRRLRSGTPPDSPLDLGCPKSHSLRQASL